MDMPAQPTKGSDCKLLDAFKRALLRRERLSEVRDRLLEEAQQNYDNECYKIEKSHDAARFINWTLKEPPETEQYQLARSFLERYSADTGEPIAEEPTEPVWPDLLAKPEPPNEGSDHIDGNQTEQTGIDT